MKRVLFVDDESNILSGLRRTLRPLHKEWDMVFVTSGKDALLLMDKQPFDVIVSDMRMPIMNGVQLLKEVKERFPATLRIILSGYAETETTLESTHVAHQFLAKPCSVATLQSTVNQTTALCGMLANQHLVSIISHFDSLPSLPRLYVEVTDELNSPSGSLERVGKIMAKDVAMTAKILQLVNSAFFGLPQHVSSSSQAVNLLGIDVVRGLVLSTKVFSSFDQDAQAGIDLDSLWEHSAITGVLAKQIAASEGMNRTLQENAFLGGMMHDIGKLVLAVGLPDESSKVAELVATEDLLSWEAEQRILGCTHAEIGSYLLGLWGLPGAVVASVAFHHQPGLAKNDSFSTTTAVHAANALLHDREESDVEHRTPRLDLDYLQQLAITANVSTWRKAQQALVS